MYMKGTKGHNKIKAESMVKAHVSAQRLIMPYTCAKFREEILNGFKIIERTRKIA